MIMIEGLYLYAYVCGIVLPYMYAYIDVLSTAYIPYINTSLH